MYVQLHFISEQFNKKVFVIALEGHENVWPLGVMGRTCESSFSGLRILTAFWAFNWKLNAQLTEKL